MVPSQVIQQFDSGSVRLEALPANEAVLVRFEMLLHLVLPQVPPRHQHGITFWKKGLNLFGRIFEKGSYGEDFDLHRRLETQALPRNFLHPNNNQFYPRME